MGNCLSCCGPPKDSKPCIDVEMSDNDTTIMCCMIKIKRNSDTQINNEIKETPVNSSDAEKRKKVKKKKLKTSISI